MTCLVGTRYGGGVFAIPEGTTTPMLAGSEEELKQAMVARLKTSGQYPAETRRRWRWVELEFHPWKPEAG
jgi:hypothetical protein